MQEGINRRLYTVGLNFQVLNTRLCMVRRITDQVFICLGVGAVKMDMIMYGVFEKYKILFTEFSSSEKNNMRLTHSLMY